MRPCVKEKLTETHSVPASLCFDKQPRRLKQPTRLIVTPTCISP